MHQYSIVWYFNGRHVSALNYLSSCLWFFSIHPLVRNVRVWHKGFLVARQATYFGV